MTRPAVAATRLHAATLASQVAELRARVLVLEEWRAHHEGRGRA